MRTTTSRSSSAPPCLNLPPRLVLDCVIAPPFYLPKEMYCSMADAYADVAARPVFESEINENDDEDEGESDITGRINNRTKAIEGGGGDMAEPSPSFWDSSPLSTPPAVEQQDDPFADMDVDNSPDGGYRDISLGPGAGSSSAPLKRKRAFSISPSTQRDHRTSSPSCARTGPEALALFGSSLSLYSPKRRGRRHVHRSRYGAVRPRGRWARQRQGIRRRWRAVFYRRRHI
ncbi:hypothetical protein DFH11DRAFT_647330 [Phellopilus nigrolimitatus]|nr:hypothetical protein DFH11DRAFT_647330 [Phellopilus nigrolimitatus]